MQTSRLEVTAQVLTLAAALLLPAHNNYMEEANGKPCSGAGKKPKEVFNNVYTKVGQITSFCRGSCSTIFRLVPDGSSFKWEDRGVYGYEDGGRWGP